MYRLMTHAGAYDNKRGANTWATVDDRNLRDFIHPNPGKYGSK